MPVGGPGAWQPRLLWLHVLSGAGIVLAAVTIAVALLILLRRRRTLPFPSLVALFAAFFLAYGAVHLVQIVSMWSPAPWVEGVAKAFAALVSLAAAAMLLPLAPRALALRDPEELDTLYADLQAAKRKQDLAEAELRSREEQVRELAGRLLSVQEEERRRIARDLHDDVVQDMMLLQVEVGRLTLKHGPDSESGEDLKQISDRMALIHEKLRNVSHRMHPSVIEFAGLRRALQQICADVDNCESSIDASVDDLPLVAQLNIYRIVQEALSNVVKHAQADNVQVMAVRQNGEVKVTVADDGCGFDPSSRSDGLGLRSMRERVQSRHGEIDIESSPHNGTRISVSFSLPGGQS